MLGSMRLRLLVPLLVVLLPTLAHCSGDERKKTSSSEDAGAAGLGNDASGGNDTPAAGGSDANAAGHPGEGGNAGTATSTGGADAGAGALIEAGTTGAGGDLGAGGGCSDPGPTHCCSAEDPPCQEDWELECYNDWNNAHYCCDSALGVRRQCSYDGDFYSYSDVVCLNPCTGQGYGTESCTECLGGYPECTQLGTQFSCGAAEVCQNANAGFALTCFAGRQVSCVCDPDAP
jgi:hypothetical protein